jgi:outer membrane lipoprotein-sorting protein
MNLKGEDLMRRKAFILLAAAVAGVLLLTACTSSENEDMQAAGAGTASATASQTISGQSVDGQSSGTGDSTLVGGTGSAASDTSAATDGTGQAGAGESSTAASDGSGTTTGSLTDSSDASAGVITGEFDGVAVEDSDESEVVTGDIWSGVYSDEEETVTVTYLDAETIAFAFTQSGISGKAEVKGTQAVYKGDDYHVVVFNIQDDVLTVDVASEEDYDVSGSPLIGTYTREQEEPTT